MASLTLYSWHLPKPSLEDGVSAITVSVDLDSLRIVLLRMHTLLLSWAHVKHLIPSALPRYLSGLNAWLSAISLPFSPKWRVRPCLFLPGVVLINGATVSRAKIQLLSRLTLPLPLAPSRSSLYLITLLQGFPPVIPQSHDGAEPFLSCPTVLHGVHCWPMCHVPRPCLVF